MAIKTVKDNIFYFGSLDPERKIFDQLVPLPDGTSYNSYFVKGSEKSVLIDTVHPTKVQELTEKIKEAGIQKLDYIVSNHAEQDHSGSLPVLLELFPDVQIITNQKCKELIIDLLHVDPEKITVVGEGDTISLGDKTLQFIMAPWVHWPDTMFTYIKEDKAIFTGDFLGSHLSDDIVFVENEARVYDAAKRYYAEIMMPFRSHSAKYVKKLQELELDIIMPSHGPVHDKPSFILDAYEDWTSDNVKRLVMIPYVSMYESTKIMVEYLAEELKKKNIEVHTYDLIETDIGEVAVSLVDAAAIVVGCSMVLAGPHPSVAAGAFLINALRPKAKLMSIIGSYGWGGNMIGKIQEMLGNIKAEVLEPVVIKGRPKDEDLKLLDRLANELATKCDELCK